MAGWDHPGVQHLGRRAPGAMQASPAAPRGCSLPVAWPFQQPRWPRTRAGWPGSPGMREESGAAAGALVGQRSQYQALWKGLTAGMRGRRPLGDQPRGTRADPGGPSLPFPAQLQQV